MQLQFIGLIIIKEQNLLNWACSPRGKLFLQNLKCNTHPNMNMVTEFVYIHGGKFAQTCLKMDFLSFIPKQNTS